MFVWPTQYWYYMKSSLPSFWLSYMTFFLVHIIFFFFWRMESINKVKHPNRQALSCCVPSNSSTSSSTRWNKKTIWGEWKKSTWICLDINPISSSLQLERKWNHNVAKEKEKEKMALLDPAQTSLPLTLHPHGPQVWVGSDAHTDSPLFQPEGTVWEMFLGQQLARYAEEHQV